MRSVCGKGIWAGLTRASGGVTGAQRPSEAGDRDVFESAIYVPCSAGVRPPPWVMEQENPKIKSQ